MPTSTIVNILGIGINAVDMPMTVAIIEHWIKAREKRYVCVMNVHCIMEGRRNPKLLWVYKQAGLRTPDGMPLVWISHLKKQRHVRRVYGPDLMTTLCSINGYGHFLYGGSEHVLTDLEFNLKKRFSNLNLVGTYSPPFRDLTPGEDDQIVALINESHADIVWVALGTPRQDSWMYDHRLQLNAPVLIGVGAAFDFLSGYKRQAPRWMRRNALEWLFRLISEPRRLWRRYMIDSPVFIILVIAQFLRLSDRDRPQK